MNAKAIEERKKRPYTPVTRAERKQIALLHREKKPTGHIMRITGRNRTTIWQICRDADGGCATCECRDCPGRGCCSACEGCLQQGNREAMIGCPDRYRDADGATTTKARAGWERRRK